MDNPYIVKEDTPYTIKHFVTGRPLDDDERIVPDEHGNYPVSPLGFLYEDTDGSLNPVPTSTFGSRPNDAVVDKVMTALAGKMYSLANTPARLYGTCPAFDVVEMVTNDESYTIVVDGDIRELNDGTVLGYLSNADNRNDYSILGILGAIRADGTGMDNAFDLTWGSNAIYDELTGHTTITLPKDTNWRLTGRIGEGRLLLNVLKNVWDVAGTDGRYVFCQDTGIVYACGSTSADQFSIRLKQMAGDAGTDNAYSPDDFVSTGMSCDGTAHIRNGYSDREVMEWVDGKIGGILASGAHPSSRTGDVTGAGALTRWFISNGTVDISGGMRYPVMVDGFGLGAGYFGDSVGTAEREVSGKPRFHADGTLVDYGTPESERVTTLGTPETGYVDHPPVGHPVLTFGYGARHDASAVNGNTALPVDWPFTSNSSNTTNNNITFPGKAVSVDGKSVGGLIGATAYDTCPVCGGAGHVDGIPCENCNGTGDVNPVKVDLNRAHICVYNDFRPNGADDADKGYSDGSTVLKKTFIHLGAPLDTEDGAEYELTVSIPSVNVAEAFGGDDVAKNLSAYYSYVSQPRVYVMGGTWKFSNDRVLVDTPESREPAIMRGTGTFHAPDGEPVPVGTTVKFALESIKMRPYRTEFLGQLTKNDDGGYCIECDGSFPYDIGGRGWVEDDMYICGLAYTDPASVEDHNPSTTSLGILSRTDATVDSSDFGNGDAGSLDEYNKFFSLDGGAGRTAISEHADHRYVLATVYPTATNTFPWAIAGRRKISVIDRILTDEINAAGSVLDLAWRANRDLLSLENIPLPMSNENRDIIRKGIGWKDSDDTFLSDWDVDEHKISYTVNPQALSDTSVLPRMLRVRMPKYIQSTSSADTNRGEPYEVVRRAKDAISDLVSDFGGLRLRYSANKRTGGKSYIPTSVAGDPFTWNTAMFGSEAEVSDDSSIAEIWRMRMRHVPRYIYDADAGESNISDRYSYNDYEPFKDAAKAREIYRAVNARYVSDLGSTMDVEDIPCDIDSAPAKEAGFAGRSAISDILATNGDFTGTAYYTDLLRESEVQSVGIDADMLSHPYRYRYGDAGKSGIYEIVDAYTKIMSIDGVPCPSDRITLDDVIGSISADRRAYVGNDAFASYRYECADSGVDTDFEFVSATLPTTDSELSNFLRTYVPMYAAKMPLRSWDSFRVYVPKGGLNTSSQVYYSRLKWLGASLDACQEDMKRSYANDMFIRGSKAPNTQDVNLSWHNTDTESSTTYLESSASVPPGTISRKIYSRPEFGGSESGVADTYIRVFMKFVFSAKAGRWYCADYRQAPVSYLSPLYGAKALDATMPSIYYTDGRAADVVITTVKGVKGDAVSTATTDSYESIWKESMCGGYTWQDATRTPYYNYTPMDISAGVVPFMYKVFPYVAPQNTDGRYGRLMTLTDGRYGIDQGNDASRDNYMSRLDKPYLPYSEGGIGLYPPANCNGEYNAGAHTMNGSMANFWSVRKHVRPAVSAMPGTDIPGCVLDDMGNRVVTRTGGSMSDPTLWSQFAYPAKGEVDYHLPDPEYPMDDMAECVLIYKDENGIGKIQSGAHTNTVYAFKK